jgi:hypothetical protein
MKRFIHKYVERFKNIKNALEPSKMKKTKGPFCDGKTLIENTDLYLDGLVALKSMQTDFDNGSLYLSYFSSNGTYYGIDIEHFADFIDSGGGANNYGRLAGYYLATMYPNDDIRDYYFQVLSDLESTTSYPQLPPPNGVSEYVEWLDDSDRPFPFGNSNANNPPCVQVRSNTNDYTLEDVKVVGGGANAQAGNISGYNKPGYKNIYYKKGYAMQHELRVLSQSSYPDLIIYDGDTLNPNSLTGENYPEISYKDWLTSDSQYPDINGAMQTTTPYAPYSYKDFLFRLKSWAENPSYEDGVLKFPFYALFSGNANKNYFHITRFRGLFFGIDVEMTPHQVFNHFHKMKKIFDAVDYNNNNNNHIEEPIAQGETIEYIPLSILNHSNFSWQGQNPPYSTNADWVTGYFEQNNHYNHAQNSGNGLPSGQGMSIADKIKDAGTLGLHNGGAENCEGCDWGCWWDFKTRGKKCSNTQNRAFPFKDKSDCENFRTQYPDYLCTKWREDGRAIDIDRNVLTGVYVAPDTLIGCTDPTAYNFCATCTSDDGSCIYHNPFLPLDCTDDCLTQPIINPVPYYPGITHIQCGITEFSFNQNTQEFYVKVCGDNSSFEITDDNQGVILSGGSFPVGSSTYFNPISPGRYTAKGTCSNSANASYWDICLDWSIPPSGSYPGSYKEVSCSNRKTPCCSSGSCITEDIQTKDII